MIGTLLEKLFVSVGVDLSGFGSELSSATGEVDKAANDMKRSFADVGKSWQQTGQKMMKSGAVLSAAVTAPLVIFGGQTLKAASDAQEMQSAFDVVFGEMANDIRKWADATGNAMGRSTQEIQRGALAFQELFGKALDPAKAAELSKQFAVLTQDLASFKNLSNEAAQQKLFSGLTGEAEPLRAVGVFLNEAAVEAKLLELGIQGVNGKFTDQEKILGRAAVIQEQLASANGDVIRTSDSLANQQRAAAAAFEELSVTAGTVLIPALTPLVKIAADLLNGFNQLDPGVQTFIIGAAAIAAAVGPALIGIGGLVTGVGALLPVLSASVPIITAVGGALLTLATGPLGLITAAVAGLYLVWRNWDSIAAFVSEWSRKIDGYISGLVEKIKTSMVDRLNAIWEGVKLKIEAVKQWFFGLYDAVVGRSYIPDMVDEIGQNMARLQSLMVDPAKAATTSTKEAFRGLASDVSGVLDRLFPLQAQLRSVLDDMAKLDKARAAGQINQATYDAASGKLYGQATDLRAQIQPPSFSLNGASLEIPRSMELLSDALAALPPIASDAELALQDFGEQLGDGIMVGLRAVLSGRGSVADVARDLLSRFFERTITDALKSLETSIFGEGGLGGFLGSLFSSVISGRAVGGPVVPGRAYTVGAGEKFVPSQTGRVLSRSDAMAALGGSSGGIGRIAVTVNGARGNAEIMDMVRAGVAQGLSEYDQIVPNRVDDGQRRRG